MQTAGPAAAPLAEAQPAEFLGPPPLAGAETRTAHPHSIDPAAAAGAIDATAEADPIAGWFDKRELKLGAAGDDKSAMFVDPAACVYPDAFLRSLAGGRDDCGLLKPGADESEILTLPFLALSAWVLVICGVAGLHHFYRNWRLWRWLRSMRAQGLVPSARIGDVRPTAGTAGRAGIAEQLRGATRAEPITRPISSARAEWRAAPRAELCRAPPARLWSGRRDRCAPHWAADG